MYFQWQQKILFNLLNKKLYILNSQQKQIDKLIKVYNQFTKKALKKYKQVKKVTIKDIINQTKINNLLSSKQNQMKIYLTQDCYKWLAQLKIIKAYIVPQQSINRMIHQQQTSFQKQQNCKRYQLCYDDQIYLENGYLIGILLKQILKQHQLFSQKLLKIRKITVLKKQQNWDIIQQVLNFLEYPFDGDIENTQNIKTYDPKQIQRILQFLYNDYGPFSELRKNRNEHYFHINPQRLYPHYEKNRLNNHLDGVLPYSYSNCNNLLQYTCFLIHKSFDFQIKIQECMGLLVDNGKYLKALIIKGMGKIKKYDETNIIKNQRFQKIQSIYQEILNSICVFEELLVHQPGHVEQFMQIFAVGVISQSQNVAKLAGLLIESIQNQQWFKMHGLRIMVRSQWPQILSLIIQKSKGCYKQIFSQSLQELFVYEQDFLLFLVKFLPVLSKSMYCKQVLECIPLSYFIQKSIQTFDPDNITSSQPKVRQLCRQVLAILIKNFFKKLPQIQRSRASIAFQTNSYYGLNMSINQNLSLLINLFEVIKVFLINEDSMVEKYFKIAIRYLKAKQIDTKQIVMQNLKQLYFTMRKSFPLGAFLSIYQQMVTIDLFQQKKNKNDIKIIPIAQNINYQFLLAISKDQSLVQQQVIKTLNITLQYYLQINGDCFLEIIINLLKFKQCSEWCVSVSQQILNKWTQIKLPPLISNIYNRKSPQQLCRFQAFGVKRRQILKFQQYQKYKSLLQAICHLKDGAFLRFYSQKVNKKIQQINKNKQLGAYNIYLKKLLDKIKICKQLLPEPMQLAAKSLIYLSQGMRGNDRFVKQIQNLNENQNQQEKQDQLQGQHNMYINSKFNRLRDEVSQSPINQNKREYKQMIQSNQLGTDDELNQFLQTRNKALKNNNKLKQNNDHEDDQNSDQRNNKKINNQNNKDEQNKRIKNQIIQNDKYLSQFTQDTYKVNKLDKQVLDGLFIYPEQFEQFQLTYIKIQKQNNDQLIQYCTNIYLQSMKNNNYQIGLINFLKQIKFSKYIPQKQAISVWLKVIQLYKINQQQNKQYIQTPIKINVPLNTFNNKSNNQSNNDQLNNDQFNKLFNNNQYEQDNNNNKSEYNNNKINELPFQKVKQIVWQLLVQYSFLMFGFRRNTRIRIKFIQVFLKLLKSALQQTQLIYHNIHQLNIHKNKQNHNHINKQINNNSKLIKLTIMKRQMLFQNCLISNKLLRWNPQYENKYLRGELINKNNDKLSKLINSKQIIVSQVLQNHNIKLLQNKLNNKFPQKSNQKIINKDNNNNKDNKVNNNGIYQMRQVLSNSLQVWLICFSIVNDILLQSKNKQLSFGLIEPLSKITTSVIIDKQDNTQSKQNNKQDYQNNKLNYKNNKLIRNNQININKQKQLKLSQQQLNIINNNIINHQQQQLVDLQQFSPYQHQININNTNNHHTINYNNQNNNTINNYINNNNNNSNRKKQIKQANQSQKKQNKSINKLLIKQKSLINQFGLDSLINNQLDVNKQIINQLNNNINFNKINNNNQQIMNRPPKLQYSINPNINKNKQDSKIINKNDKNNIAQNDKQTGNVQKLSSLTKFSNSQLKQKIKQRKKLLQQQIIIKNNHKSDNNFNNSNNVINQSNNKNQINQNNNKNQINQNKNVYNKNVNQNNNANTKKQQLSKQKHNITQQNLSHISYNADS